jgi:hypothetical protein
MRKPLFVIAISALGLNGCVSMPTGPSVMVLPGSNQSFEQFRIDDANCRAYALSQVDGKTPQEASIESSVGTAAVGTAIGAGLGAAAAGGSGAAVGAGAGLVTGSIIGSGNGWSSWYTTQQHYDVGYIQCMYALGHRVPVNGQFAPQPAPPAPHYTPSPARASIPPPPPGSPPPPPPAGSPPPPPPLK